MTESAGSEMRGKADPASSVRPVLRAVLDAVCIALAFGIALAAQVEPGQTFAAYLAVYWPYLAVALLVWLWGAGSQGLFLSWRNQALVRLLLILSRSFFSMTVVSLFLMGLLTVGGIPRWFALLFLVLACLFILLSRLVVRFSHADAYQRFGAQRAIIVGANDRAVHLAEVLRANEHEGYSLEGFVEDDPDRRKLLEDEGAPFLGTTGDLEDILRSRVVDGVYVALPLRSHYGSVLNIAHLCESVGVPVRLVADLFPLRLSSARVTEIAGHPFVSLAADPFETTRFAWRRTIEWLSALVLLIVLSPVMAISALAVRTSSRGPALMRRPLPGNGGAEIFVFRTVHADTGKPVSGFGAWLHRHGLDELPQLLNVIRGELGFGGTRDGERRSRRPGVSVRRRARWTGLIFPLFALLDCLGLLAAYVYAVVESSISLSVAEMGLVSNLPYLLVFVVVWFSAAIGERLFTERANLTWADFSMSVLKATGDATIFGVFVMTLLAAEGVDREFLFYFTLAAAAVLLAAHGLFHVVRKSLQGMGRLRQRALVIGANDRMAQLLRDLPRAGRQSYEFVGLLDDDLQRGKGLCQEFGMAHLGGLDAFAETIKTKPIDAVYTGLPMRTHYAGVRDIARIGESHGLPIYLLADLFPLRVASNRLTYLTDIPLLSLSAVPETYGRLVLKRLMDFVLSSALIALLSPAFLVMAIVIKFDSKGPIFFAQERVGRNQRRFKMLKFRSMVVNAEELRAKLEAQNEADGPVFKIRNDPRITRIGRFIRRYSIDEFPQLFNVWLGQMSLVGPRPPIPAEVEEYRWDQRRRLSVTPGMTGLWQVSGRSEIAFEEWVELDLAYIDSWSLFGDLVILFKTFRAVVTHHGAA